MQPVTFSLQKTAKLIGFPGGRNKFIKWLREKKYLLDDNEPTQKYVDNEWLVYKIKPIFTGMTSFDATVTRTTVKGLAGLERHVKRDFPNCKPCEDEKPE